MSTKGNAQFAPVLMDDSQDPSEAPGGFISYTSMFPNALAPKSSGFFSLSQLATQADAPQEREKTCTECRALVFQLMATTVHDSNNLLTILLGQIEVILLKTQDNRTRWEIEALRPLAKRLAELNHQMLDMAHLGTKPEVEPLDVAEAVLKIVPICLVNSGIQAECDLDGLRPIMANPILFSQAIQNLVINARQAMPEGGACSRSAASTSKIPWDENGSRSE